MLLFQYRRYNWSQYNLQEFKMLLFQYDRYNLLLETHFKAFFECFLFVFILKIQALVLSLKKLFT